MHQGSRRSLKSFKVCESRGKTKAFFENGHKHPWVIEKACI